MIRIVGVPSAMALALASALLSSTGCAGKNEYVAPPPPEVAVAQPVTEEVTDYAEFTGTTRAVDSVDLRARVSGYLHSIEFEDGAYVKQGQLLFVIEPEPFEVALASEKAKLRKAQAALKLADAEVERTRPLVKRGALAVQELDVKIADSATAAADVAAAQAAVDQAELNLRYTRITAPISGRIGRHLVDVGNLVQMQTTMLTTIETVEPIHVYFNVSESDVLRFTEEETHSGPGAAEPPPLYVGLSENGGFSFEGHLDFTELGVDPNTGTQQRRGVVANKDRALLPGLFVRVRIPLGGPEPELLVSERAIGADQRGQFVLVVNDKNIVERRPDVLGPAHNGNRVIKKGLDAGEWVVVNGLQRARPGAPVNPTKEGAVAESSPAESSPAESSPVESARRESQPDGPVKAAKESEVAKSRVESSRPRGG